MSGVHMRTEKSIRNIVYGEVNVILTVLLSIVPELPWSESWDFQRSA